MIQAQVVADSITQDGHRITTMVVTMPRFILAEFNTHRAFSRNTASSRAIPFEKMLESVREHPFFPIAWQKDHKGMQGTEYFNDKEGLVWIENAWMDACADALKYARYLNQDKGITKQLANRLLEPFMWTTVIVTSTEWENFFELRCPQYGFDKMAHVDGTPLPYFRSKKDAIKYINIPLSEKNKIKVEDYDDLHWLAWNKGQAEIHMMALAEAMWDAYNESTPVLKLPGDWHIPFEDKIIAQHGTKLEPDEMRAIATAMCARTSYTLVGESGKRSKIENDIKLHDQLLESKHMSPFEHCAVAPDWYFYPEDWPKGMTHVDRDGGTWSGNLKGWMQYRQIIEQNEKSTT